MALKGALDAEYRLDKDEHGIIRAEATKMKEAEPPEPMAFILRSVELGFNDEDGNPVTSAILDSVSYQPASKPGTASRGKWQTIGMQALEDLEKEHRQRLEDKGYSPDTARVSIGDWRNECFCHDMSRQTFQRSKHRFRKTEL